MQEPVPIPVEQLAEPNKKRHLNVVLIGHADSGKSTIGGQILCLTNQVDQRAVANNRESSYLANMMGPKKSETQYVSQVGRAFFETESNRFTVLDVPVISARRGEIDRAFYEDFWLSFPASGKIISEEQKDKFRKEILGQTLEHVEVAKNLGVSKLIVVANKMDDPTVNWSEDRYDQIKQKMVGFLELTGYNIEEDVVFLPMSGLRGINMDKRMHQNVCNWWGDRPYFFKALDSIEVPSRDANGPFRMLITGICESKNEITGKVESGTIRVGDHLVIMPIEVMQAGPFEALKVYITGADEMDIRSGFVLSSTVNLVPVVDQFFAKLKINKRLSRPDFVMSGTRAKIYIHGVLETCYINIVEHIDPQTRKRTKNKGILRRGDVALCRIMLNTMICVDGRRRFILMRMEDDKPLAAGRVTNV